MPYPDLSTMFQNGMGSFAAVQAGQMQQSQQAQDAALLQKQQLENQQTQVMNPLNAQFKQGEINSQQAQLPGQVGLSQQQAVAGNVAQATQADQIAEKLYGLKNQIGAQGFTEMAQNAQIASYAASMLESVPAMNRPQALSQILSKYGVSSDNPMVKPIIEGDPNNIVPALNNLGKGMALASAKYQQDSAIESQRAAAQLAAAKAHAEGSVTAETIRAHSNETIGAGHDTAKLASAQARVDAMMSKMKPEDRFTMLNAIPDEELTSAQRIEKNRLVQFVMAARAAGANQTPSQLLAGSNVDTPAQRAVSTADALAPTNPKPVTPPSLVPAGMKQVGTSGGKPVYEDAKGKQWIGK